MDVSAMVNEGLRTMGTGIGVVFVVLAVFYLVIKLMMRLFPARESDKGEA